MAAAHHREVGHGKPPVSDDWIHEIKYDGFRTQMVLDWAGGRAFTKMGHDWSKRYWPIVTALEKLKAKSLILDGEMIAPEECEDLRPRPAIERKAILWDLIKPADGIIQCSQHVEGGGAEFFEAAEKMGLEGMVSKQYRKGVLMLAAALLLASAAFAIWWAIFR
ncbi:hypothetical protein [Mesorhizobium sp. M1396]|uniref:ATP-dependent DNA ligase n=1 Tax=Mesorhizobium sp. M1396 TaxID=2957095 RepID=UPI00333D771A